jgi:hypothetical protein
MPAPAPEVRGEEEVFQLTLKDSPPFLPEPDSAPSVNEYLPFVSVGAGATGQDGLMAAYADALLDHARITREVEAFARAAGQGRSGSALVAAVYSAVMARLTGRDEGLGTPAAASLAQERGSRMWLLKAALESLGVEARVALVRPFSADPGSYRFPTETSSRDVRWSGSPPRSAPTGRTRR